MKQILLFSSFIFSSILNFAQIGLPIQTSLLPKNNLVVNYDFSKSTSFTRGATSVTNIAGTASGNATIYNAPIFMNSLGFVSFNGSNQYLATPNLKTYFKSVNATVQKSFTMSFWVYPTTNTGVLVSELDSQTPSGGWHATNIELINGVINYRVWASSNPVTSSPIALNQWHHIALVYDGTSFKGYLNGVLQGARIYAREIPTSSQNYAIGAGETTNMGTGAYGTFHLAQFKLHNLPLSDQEIAQEYNLRKDEMDYTIHSPSTNNNPVYWTSSSNWTGDVFYANAPSPSPVTGYHFTPWINSPQGWSAGVNDLNQFLTLSYDEPANVKGVVIQGRANGAQWVTKAHLETSLTGSAPWTRQLTSVLVNSNYIDDVRLNFSSNVLAKAIRFVPADWSGHITMRFGMLVVPNKIVTDGLVFNLDAANLKSYSGTGSVWKDLIGSNDATIYNSPVHNSATDFTFNGSTQYGSIPSVSGITDFTNSQKYTVEVWFKPTNGQLNSVESELLEKWNKNNESKYPFTIRFNESTTSMLVACYDGTNFRSATSSGFPVNTWKQLVAVFNFVDKTLTVYRDGGNPVSVSLTGVGQVSNTSPIAIASRLTSTGAAQSNIMFKGSIGIIRTYNIALSESQILQNFNAIRSRFGL